MKPLGTVAIVGVGLIGGSIGLALRQRNLAQAVVGIGHRQVSLRVARRVGAITQTTVDLSKGVVDADLVIVCTPVGMIVDQVREAAKTAREGTLFTDAGSTKEAIVAALDSGLPRNCRFLGGHPIAGSEKSGASAANADLFDGKVCVLTPTKNTRAEDFDLLESFWQRQGSIVIRLAPQDHDRGLAVTSHVPHVAAAALANALPESLFRLAGSGIIDSTRLAAGDPSLWRQILIQNRGNVLNALEQYGGQLSAFHAAIRDRNEAELERLLATAKKNRDALGS